jgi:tetratricopeptide (TPR) repeat protein
MKKNLFSLFISFYAFIATAQVNFSIFSTFDAVLEQAKQDKKLIFIQFESEKCVQCYDVAMAGLASTQLKEKYAVNFLSLKTKKGDNLYANLLEKYQLTNEFMGSLYLDNQGKILLKQSSTTSHPTAYLQWADKAISNVDKLSEVDNLEKMYQKGDRSAVLMEKYILAMRDAGKNGDAILDEYVGQLIVDSLHSDRIIQLVKEQGLSLNARAYKLITNANPNKKIDSLWFLIPLSKRISINNRTTSQTFSEAVRTKNNGLMYQLGNFTHNIYSPNYRKGEFVAKSQLVDYHRVIKDTMGFLNRAQSFANILLRVNIDSLKAWTAKDREDFFTSREGATRFRPTSNQYADELNKLAWQCYEFTSNSRFLESALTWSERSMTIYKDIPSNPEVTENPAYMDTYAHILYKLNRFDEAIEWQNKAIEAQKMGKIQSDGYEKERDKMINRRL